ncbi:MAG TPA: ATP-binding cassette domain-containing protein [Gemmatimonadales bacterium]|nr:ATP-binding cassette domain-containing protein [Gemmatimonadales bacterium]
MNREPAVLTLSGIRKSFGPVQALRGADFVLAPGEVHALLGENGAGKSTLLRIAYGMIAPDAGTIRVRGDKTVIRSPRVARGLGVGMVHQHFTSIDAMSVAENIALSTGRLRAGDRLADGSGEPGKLMEGLLPNATVGSLSVALRQRLEIVKALMSGARILLLDEPSAVLAPSEVDALLALVREFVEGGGAAALITHKLREVFAAADQVTVLRQGAVTYTGAVAGQTEETLARAMIGPSMEPDAGRPTPSRPPARESPPVLAQLGGIPLRAGELIGVAAVEGNGQRELFRALALRGAGESVALVPEDRSIEGLIPDFSITENMVLGLDRDPRWSSGIWLDWNRARLRTAELMETYGVRAVGTEAPARTLSGGNQQKVVLARALARGPAILIAENPTRGLDIRASAFVHEQLRKTADAGVLVLVYSTDLDEVLALGRRVLVVHAGRVAEAPAMATREVVGTMMLGVAQ